MSNEIIRHQQLPVTEIMSIGKAFAESGMFPDTKQAAQAIVKIQAGQEIGIPPFAAMTGIHIIQGKPTIGANLIAAKIKDSAKYDYKVVDMTDNKCSLDFYEGKTKIGNSTFTIEDAKKAQTKNLDKFPKNMLFARAISNGVKWFCPDVFMGPVYTPEDFNVEQTTVDGTAEVMTETSKELKPSQPLTIVPESSKESTATKEPITLSIIQKIVNRIKKGDTTILEKAKATYEMSEGEIKILQDEIDNLNKNQTAA